ncbi:carbohydrate-responsive element-binding protein [Sergentomyia squamirostris]
MIGMSMSLKFGSGESKKDRETIHSGQFMVSHFEAEAQEDWDDEEMPDPDKSTETTVSVNTCTDIQKYVPRTTIKLASRNHELSIETSLTKLFNCMKLAYRQKLTSPKWNRFKGIRLRWKDKIRLNNLIWRCWHMQFIMRKKTLCQFASPLDCDIHNKPEAVVLEGKYWKRDLLVISAEYKKWRRFHHHRTLEHSNALETLSERDFDWSSNDDRSLTNIDDCPWTSDLLFSTISQPFQFPDSREIARGAGIADFIQPSLGPLQPNLDDFMDACETEFFGPSRLPPVLEEPPEDLFKSINLYIMGSEPMESVNMSEISSGGGSNQVQNNVPSIGSSSMITNSMGQQSQKGEVYPNQQNYTVRMVSQDLGNVQGQQQQQQSFNANIQTYQKPPIASMVQTSTTGYNQSLGEKSSQHGTFNKSSKISRNSLKHLSRREPHNYEKAQPTQHQTEIYNQILIQQQEQQQSLQSLMQISQPSGYSGNFQGATSNQIQQHQMPSPVQMQQNSQTLYSLLSQQNQQNQPNQQPCNAFDQRSTSPTKLHFTHYKSMSMNYTGNQMGNNTVPLMNVQATNVNNSNMMATMPEATAISSKEMYRSNSLPLNATLPFTVNSGSSKETNNSQFALPKYQPKSKARSRSNSIVMKSQSQQQQIVSNTLQAATSEPALLQLLQQQSVPPSSTLGGKFSGSQTNIAASSSSSSTTTTKRLDSSPGRLVGNESPSSSVGMSPEVILDHHDMGPLSPSKDNSKYPQRRAGHIHAEQKRRYNIKNGFDVLQSLIPQLQQNPSAKLSKAAILQKGAEYIRQLKSERAVIHDKTEALRKERDQLNSSLNYLHSNLPANGAPVSRQRTGRVLELYNQYVRYRSMDNWKFWIFGLIFEPLLNSFNSTVSIASLDELCRTTMQWVDQNCSLVELRPAVTNKLRYLSTNTDVLSENPSTLREEVLKAISAQQQSQLQSRSSATKNSN